MQQASHISDQLTSDCICAAEAWHKQVYHANVQVCQIRAQSPDIITNLSSSGIATERHKQVYHANVQVGQIKAQSPDIITNLSSSGIATERYSLASLLSWVGTCCLSFWLKGATTCRVSFKTGAIGWTNISNPLCCTSFRSTSADHDSTRVHTGRIAQLCLLTC